jgi:hypothetical protein
VTITFRQRSLPLDIDFQRHRLSDFQGSAVVGLPNRNEVLFTLGTRQHLPADLRRVKLGTDRVDRLSGIGGDLRAGVELRARLWLLAMYRLHELRVDPIELLQTYAVPKYGWGLLPLFGGTKLALTRINQKRVPVFSISSRSIEKNLPMAYPQLASMARTRRRSSPSGTSARARSTSSSRHVVVLDSFQSESLHSRRLARSIS